MRSRKFPVSATIGAIAAIALLLMAAAWIRRHNGVSAGGPHGALSNVAADKKGNAGGTFPEFKDAHWEKKRSQSAISVNDPTTMHLADASQSEKESSSAVGMLFGDGLRLIQEGRYKEAEGTLWQFNLKCSKDLGRTAPTYWAKGLGEYKTETLESAASYFKSFSLVSQDGESEDQVKAAQYMVATIYLELIDLAENSEDRNRFSVEAQKEIRSFLEKWPQSILALSMHISLARLESPIASP